MGPVITGMNWFAIAYSGSIYIGFGGYLWTWGWSIIVFLSTEMFASLAQYLTIAKKFQSIGKRIGAITLADVLAHRYGSQHLRLLCS